MVRATKEGKESGFCIISKTALGSIKEAFWTSEEWLFTLTSPLQPPCQALCSVSTYGKQVPWANVKNSPSPGNVQTEGKDHRSEMMQKRFLQKASMTYKRLSLYNKTNLIIIHFHLSEL